MSDAVVPTEPKPGNRFKRHFANRARDCANRVGALPGLSIYPVAALAAVIILTMAGAFGTGALAIGQRTVFWLLLIGVHTSLWMLWFAWRVRGDDDWWPATLLGMLVVNLPLPLEVSAFIELVGGDAPRRWLSLWFSAAAISAALFVVLIVAMPRRVAAAQQTAKGTLWRAGYHRPEKIAAIAAEDHYCRVWASDGTSRLIHARFGDLTDEVAMLDGALVRRGQWIAASAIAGISRDGRRWVATTRDGRAIPISPSAAATLRARGWIGRSG